MPYALKGFRRILCSQWSKTGRLMPFILALITPNIMKPEENHEGNQMRRKIFRCMLIILIYGEKT